MKVKGLAAKSKYQAKKNMPEILIGLGISFFGWCVVESCKATLKAQQPIADCVDDIEDYKVEAEENEVPEKEQKKEIRKIKIATGLEVAKIYAGPVIIGTIGVCCVTGSYKIQKKTIVSSSIAYFSLDQAFKEYRNRIRDAIGKEEEQKICYGTKDEKVETKVTDEKGKTKTVSEQITRLDDRILSQYAFFFDASSPLWTKSAEYNKDTVMRIESYLNDELVANGIVTLNDVRDAFHLERTEAGQIVGWRYDPDRTDGQDNHIDLGIFTTAKANRDFVNGYEPVILLDPNVNGPVYEYYPRKVLNIENGMYHYI